MNFNELPEGLKFKEAKKALKWLLENEIEYVVRGVAATYPDGDYAAQQIKQVYNEVYNY